MAGRLDPGDGRSDLDGAVGDRPLDCGGGLGTVALLDENGERVAADPEGGIVIGDGASQGGRHRHELAVAGGASVREVEGP